MAKKLKICSSKFPPECFPLEVNDQKKISIWRFTPINANSSQVLSEISIWRLGAHNSLIHFLELSFIHYGAHFGLGFSLPGTY
jgi:hypothetical protein